MEAVYSAYLNPHLKSHSCFITRLKWLKWRFLRPAVCQKKSYDCRHFERLGARSGFGWKGPRIGSDVTSGQTHSGCFLMNVHLAVTGTDGGGRFIERSALMCSSETPARFYCFIWWCDNVITLQMPYWMKNEWIFLLADEMLRGNLCIMTLNMLNFTLALNWKWPSVFLFSFFFLFWTRCQSLDSDFQCLWSVVLVTCEDTWNKGVSTLCSPQRGAATSATQCYS